MNGTLPLSCRKERGRSRRKLFELTKFIRELVSQGQPFGSVLCVGVNAPRGRRDAEQLRLKKALAASRDALRKLCVPEPAYRIPDPEERDCRRLPLKLDTPDGRPSPTARPVR